jgi:hypothetical protein
LSLRLIRGRERRIGAVGEEGEGGGGEVGLRVGEREV